MNVASLVTRSSMVAALGLFVLFAGCSTTYERRDPSGEQFPSVRGTALDGTAVSIPEDFSGREVLLFIGYEMDSQFDIDRWLLALRQAGVDVAVYELPTIPGLIPGLFAGAIDDGMRSGIPEEDWAVVVTIYDDAETVASFLGNENSLPSRVVLLNSSGEVVFFHDRGFSVSTLEKLQAALAKTRDTGGTK